MTKPTSASSEQGPAPQIMIIGANRMQTDLLAYFLTRRAGARCLALASLKEMDARAGEVRAIILDCTAIGSDALSEWCRRCEQMLSANELLILVNLSRDTGLEPEVICRRVRAIFYAHDSAETLGKGMQAILKSELWASDKVVGATLPSPPPAVPFTPGLLTSREEDILAMVAVGLTNEAIAERLYISSHTVKTHLYNIFRKIKVPNRLQAALWAGKHLSCERLIA